MKKSDSKLSKIANNIISKETGHAFDGLCRLKLSTQFVYFIKEI